MRDLVTKTLVAFADDQRDTARALFNSKHDLCLLDSFLEKLFVPHDFSFSSNTNQLSQIFGTKFIHATQGSKFQSTVHKSIHVENKTLITHVEPRLFLSTDKTQNPLRPCTSNPVDVLCKLKSDTLPSGMQPQSGEGMFYMQKSQSTSHLHPCPFHTYNSATSRVQLGELLR